MSIHVTKRLVVLVILRLDLPPAGLLRAPQELIVGFSEQVRLRRWKASDRVRVEKQIVRLADMVLPLLLGCGGEVVDGFMAPLALSFGVEDASPAAHGFSSSLVIVGRAMRLSVPMQRRSPPGVVVGRWGVLSCLCLLRRRVWSMSSS